MLSSTTPSLFELHYNLAHILHQQGDLAGAIESYRQAIEHNPNSPMAHLNLGVVLDKQGSRSEAVQHYRQAISLQPGYIKAYNNLGCTLVKLGQWAEAIQVYQQAIELKPDWAILYDNLAQVWANQGEVAKAIAAYRRAIQLAPNFAVAHYHLGKLFQFQSDHVAAVECFETAIQLAPDHILAHTDCAFSWMTQGKFDRAIPHLRQAINPQLEQVQAYCEWAEQLDDQTQDAVTQSRRACGRFLQALLQGNDFAALRQHWAEAYFNLANALMTYGGEAQLKQAQTYYQTTLQLQPTRLEGYLHLGNSLTQQGRSNASILLYHLALAAFPDESSLHTQLGFTLEQQHQFAAAITHYQQALQGTTKSTANRKSLVIQPVLNKPSPSSLIAPPQGFYASTAAWSQEQGERSTYIPLHPPSLAIAFLPQPCTDAAQPDHASSCQGLNCAVCLERIFRWFDVIHLGNNVHTYTNQTPGSIDPPAKFVATIPQGRVWATPQQNDWLICNAVAVLTPDNHLLADVSRDYPGQLPGCESINPLQHRIFEAEGLLSPEQIEGTVAVLAGLSGHNYYHWMVDVLPRLALLQQAGIDLAAIDHFFINYTGSKFQQDTLAALGIPLEKVISSDRYPHIQASQLLLPSFAGNLGWLEPWALEFLRQQFLPLASQATSRNLPERIYISRTNANHRRVLNEDAVIELLESFGFISVHLESMPLADQIALFANAKTIVAPHGGGLTNLIFCQPGTTVIELVTPHYVRHYYWIISQLLKLPHYFLTGEAFTCHSIRQLMYPSPLTEDIWVTLPHLKELLQKLKY